MGLTCGLWSLIGSAACCVLSYCHDVRGGRALQFISTYESICQDRLGAAGAGADFQGTTPTAHIYFFYQHH